MAMTRAKKELTICYAKKMGSKEMKASRFLQEMRGLEETKNQKTRRRNPLEKEMARLKIRQTTRLSER